MVKKLTNEIYAYALENSLHYGKAKESAVLPKLFHHGLKSEDIKHIITEIKSIVNEINILSDEEKQKKFNEYKKFLAEKPEEEKGLKELPNIKGKPVFRMAPFPSGSLHIGNARTFLLNALYAEKYKGKLLLIIDDTIGSEEKRIMFESYSLIPEAFKWLKVKYARPIIYKSDRLKIYYRYAEQLIKKDKAYVCGCSQEQLRENRANQKECGCRIYPPKENLKRWKKMFSAEEGKYTLRLKTSMKHPNPAFRDRVLFRISDREHARIGKKYRIWPLLEVSCAIDDHLLGVTHIIRGKELMMEGEMQKFIWDIFKWKHPQLIYVGLIKLKGLEGKLSKSKAQKEVMSGEYSGWDDPRTWSIQSLARRGILAESFREFTEKIGLNQNDIEVPIDELYSINRKKLDKDSNRYSFVKEPIRLEIKNAPKISEAKVKLHPDKPNTRKIKIEKEMFISSKDFNQFQNKEVRLMHLYNINLTKPIQFTSFENKPETPKINWVSQGVKTKIRMPDGTYTFGLAEEHIKSLKPEEIIQFERFGFCKFDNFNKKEQEYEFWFTHN